MTLEQPQPREDFTEQDRRASGGSSRTPPPHEIMIVKNLAASVTMPPLEKIRLILDSAYMIPSEVLGKHLDLELLKVLQTVSLVLTSQKEFHGGRTELDSMTIQGSDWIVLGWPFAPTEENYKKFIDPWLQEGFIDPCLDYWQDEENKRRKQLWEIAKSRNWTRVPEWFLFFYDSDTIYPSQFLEFKSRFLVWALPKAAEVAATTAALLSPQSQRTFERMLVGPETKS